MHKEKKKVVKTQMYKGDTLPSSSEKGVPFVDFNEVIKSMKHLKNRAKIVKKRRTNGRL